MQYETQFHIGLDKWGSMPIEKLKKKLIGLVPETV